MNRILWTSLISTISIAPLSIVQASIDVDIDNDGLIEIATLEQLDLIRSDLAGASLDGDSTGCPATGCHGYELTADLDFDTNRNGVADAGDTYWNNGLGWDPIGPNGEYSIFDKYVAGALTADFNGNGFVIRNIFINRPTRNWVGLFSNTSNSTITNIVFQGAQISGGNATGVLSGGLNDTQVSYVRVSESLASGIQEVGLLAGRFRGSDDSVEHINVEGEVSSENNSGGVFGSLKADNNDNPIVINDVISDVEVNLLYGVGGCVAGGASGIESTSLMGMCQHVIGGRNYIGGIFGSLAYSSMENVYSQSIVSSANLSTYVGGIVGNMSYSSVNKAITSQDSEVSARVPGGLIGYARYSSVTNSASHGTVIGSYYPSAFIVTAKGMTIENVYSTSPVPLQNGGPNFDSRRGLISSNTASTVVDSYWDLDETGVAISDDGLGEGKSSNELKCPISVGDMACDTSVYENWDESTWDFGTSSDYPVLR